MSSLNYLSLFSAAFVLISCVHSQDYTLNLNKAKLKPNQAMVTPVKAFELKAFPVFGGQARLEVKSDNVVYLSLAFHSFLRSIPDGEERVPVVPAVVYTLKDPNNRDVPRKNKCYATTKAALLFDKFYYEVPLRPLKLMANTISITISVSQRSAGTVCISDVK